MPDGIDLGGLATGALNGLLDGATVDVVTTTFPTFRIDLTQNGDKHSVLLGVIKPKLVFKRNDSYITSVSPYGDPEDPSNPPWAIIMVGFVFILVLALLVR